MERKDKVQQVTDPEENEDLYNMFLVLPTSEKTEYQSNGNSSLSDIFLGLDGIDNKASLCDKYDGGLNPETAEMETSGTDETFAVDAKIGNNEKSRHCDPQDQAAIVVDTDGTESVCKICNGGTTHNTADRKAFLCKMYDVSLPATKQEEDHKKYQGGLKVASAATCDDAPMCEYVYFSTTIKTEEVHGQPQPGMVEPDATIRKGDMHNVWTRMQAEDLGRMNVKFEHEMSEFVALSTRRDNMELMESRSQIVKTESEISNKIVSILKDKMHVCTLCGGTFNSQTDLFKHLQNKSRMDGIKLKVPVIKLEKLQVCALCAGVFNTKTELSEHLQSHLPPSGDENKMLDTKLKELMTNNEKFQTEKKRPVIHIYAKQLLNKSRSKLWADKDKRKLMINRITNNCQCTICDKTFVNKWTLRLHMMVHRSKESWFKCNFCDKSFAYLQSLKKHTMTHSGVKPTVQNLW